MPYRLINKVREQINVRLYKHKDFVLNSLKGLSIIVSLVAVGSIIYYHGFPQTLHSISVVHQIIQWSFVFYIIKYFLRFFYDFHPIRFLRQNLFEGIVLGLIVFDFLLNQFVNQAYIDSLLVMTGLENFSSYYIVFIQLYFFLIVLIETAKVSTNIAILHLTPSHLLVLSFIFLIFGGAGLLMLPEMTVGMHIRFIDALFTSTSASCVTGLIVVDTATFFTLKGKMIIMALIQLGGLNIITFATFFATFSRTKDSLKHIFLLKEIVTSDKVSDTRILIRRILYFSIFIEVIGIVFMFFLWPDAVYFTNIRERIFYSVFHAVSSFNNAGFSLFSNNLFEESMRFAFNFHWVVIALIFFGGLGFSAMTDIFSLQNIRERYKYHWKTLHVGTKIALYTSLTLIFAGAVFYFILEYNNTLNGYSTYGAIVTSIFQSVTPRTCGFNTVDFAALYDPTLIMIIFLMFIGASPGSTGGGIKTTTLTVLFKSAIATIRGKKNIEIYKHCISYDLVDRAYSIALFSASLIFGSAFLLSVFEPEFDFISLLFEEISAFGTVGLSTGITQNLSDSSKIILILSMYIGRIGSLTLAIALTRKALTSKYKYPNANIMIG